MTITPTRAIAVVITLKGVNFVIVIIITFISVYYVSKTD